MFRFFCCYAENKIQDESIQQEPTYTISVVPAEKKDDYVLRYYPFPGASLNINPDELTLDAVASAATTAFEGSIVNNKYIRSNLEGEIKVTELFKTLEDIQENHEPSNTYCAYFEFKISKERLLKEKITLTIEDINAIRGETGESLMINESNLTGKHLQNWVNENTKAPFSPSARH